MKPLDQFIQQMIASAQQVQAGDTGGATARIQRALRESGLLEPSGLAAAPSGLAAAPFGFAEAPEFIDINPPPAPPPGPAPEAAPAGPARKGARSKARTWKRPFAPANLPPADLGPGSFTEGSFACAEGVRRYKLYVPARAAQEPRPLLVMLHGCTQNAGDFAAGTAMNTLAEEHGCLVLYPEQDRAANHSGCWNWFEPGQQRRGAGEPAILAGMTRQIIAEHGADPKRVFVAGLSAGGAMAAILGAEYPELYAAVGVHSGLPAGTGKDMVSGLHAMKKPPRAAALSARVPLIVFHGDADHVVHSGNGEAVLGQFVDAHGRGMQERRERVKEGQGGGRAYTRRIWCDAQGCHVAEHWLIHGAGHAWMGGKPSGSHTDASGPCASTQMLSFFLAQKGQRV